MGHGNTEGETDEPSYRTDEFGNRDGALVVRITRGERRRSGDSRTIAVISATVIHRC